MIDSEPDTTGGLSIQAVSKLLNVPAPTIRSWERRYGVPNTTRSVGGHRRYLPPELQLLRQMRDEVARGRRAAEAASIVKASASPSQHQAIIDQFLAAARGLEPDAVVACLDAAEQSLGLDSALDDVLLPAMRQVGQWWESGQCDVAHEHLATEAVRGWLHRMMHASPTPWQPETLLLTCGPRDLHTLGLDCIATMLSRRGWRCRMLGARTPARALPVALQASGAEAVILVSHLSVGRRSAVDALRTIEPSNALLFYAGNAFFSRQARVGVPGTYLGETLTGGAAKVTEALIAQRK